MTEIAASHKPATSQAASSIQFVNLGEKWGEMGTRYLIASEARQDADKHTDFRKLRNNLASSARRLDCMAVVHTM